MPNKDKNYLLLCHDEIHNAAQFSTNDFDCKDLAAIGVRKAK